MRIERYDINGNRIRIAECAACGNQVNVEWAALRFPYNGIVWNNDILAAEGEFNILLFLDAVSACCQYPDYHFYVINRE